MERFRYVKALINSRRRIGISTNVSPEFCTLQQNVHVTLGSLIADRAGSLLHRTLAYRAFPQSLLDFLPHLHDRLPSITNLDHVRRTDP